MADAPGFEAQQERLYQEAKQRTRAHVVLHALAELDPGLDVTGLSYHDALLRLQGACAAEVVRLDTAPP